MGKIEVQLTIVEWRLMNICWEKGKSTARVIYEESLKDKKRGYQTVKTMLDRMVQKGYLQREKFGPLWLYEPLLSKNQTITSAIDNFVNTVLDDAVSPLFSHFVKSTNISQEDIEQLKELVELKEKEMKHGRTESNQ